ncbi:MAG: fibronectin type III domain-containing protein [Candidatus Krumholzibacteriota bacterium]|nr:fibronectin type III domain-containing protein [Candidatus Krumholzibacteriota bacterium]
MWRVAILFLLFSIIIVPACSNEHGDSPAAFLFDAPERPTGLSVTPGVNSALLEWDYPAELLDEVRVFRIYYFYESYGVAELVDSTEVTSYVDEDLIGNMVYCYRVSAVNMSGLEGWRSETVCEMVDAPSP